METTIAVALGVLGTIFMGALFILILLCRHKNIRNRTITEYVKRLAENGRPGMNLIDCEVELDEMCVHPVLGRILEDRQWIGDASGLVMHCIAVLKLCHGLMNRIAAIAMGPMQHRTTLHEILQVTRHISLRVDDVVQCMYPPVDPRLVEARTATLVLAVSQLALVARSDNNICAQLYSWISATLADMDAHLLILREVALSQDNNYQNQNKKTQPISSY